MQTIEELLPEAATSTARAARPSIGTSLWSNIPLLWLSVLLIYAFVVYHPIAKLVNWDGELGAFTTFRNAAIALSHGQDIHLSGGGEYVYPPLLAFLYQPFGWISLRAGGIVILALNTIISLFSVWLISVEMSRRFLGRISHVAVARIAALAVFIAFDKIRAEFHMWESNVLMLLMFAIALRCIDRRPSWAGAALGFAFNIKYMPLTLLPLLLIRRRWRASAAFVISAAAFALLPAVSMGWHANLDSLATAYSGLAKLFSISVHHAANLYPMGDLRSFSLTSGISRMTALSDTKTLAVAAVLGLAFVALAALSYRRNGLPLLAWPSASRQIFQPYRALFAIEWVAVILLTLVFSPFTNAQHLYMCVLGGAAGVALLMTMKNQPSGWAAIAGLIILHIGITYPPGGERFHHAQYISKLIGLPGWCMLFYCATLLWAGLRSLKRNKRSLPVKATDLLRFNEASHLCNT